VPAGDGTLRGLRSLGPIAVSTSIITLFLGLGGSSAGVAVASTAVGSIVPSISLTERPACAAREVSMYSIMASSCSSDSSLIRLRCSRGAGELHLVLGNVVSVRMKILFAEVKSAGSKVAGSREQGTS